MAFLHFGESWRNSQHIESVVEDTIVILDTNPEVKRELGPEIIGRYAAALGSMFVPNVRGGKVRMLKEQLDTDNMPIVAAKVGKRLVAGSGLGMTSAQQERFNRQTRGWKPVKEQILWRDRGREPEPISNRITRSNLSLLAEDTARTLYVPHQRLYGFATAKTISCDFAGGFNNLGDNTRRSISGRPIVGLVRHPDDPQEKLRRPSNLIHLLTHYFQYIDYPATPSPDSPTKYLGMQVTRELQACHVAARFESALYASDDPSYKGVDDFLNNRSTEDLRLQHANSDKPFAPLGVLGRKLTETGFDFNPPLDDDHPSPS